MTTLPVRSPWYSRVTVDESITLMSEPHVHPLLRSNIWHLQGRSRDVVIDTGLGVTSLKAAAPDLFTNDTLAIATHAHADHIGNFHEFAHRAIHHAEADVVATITGTLEFDISDTDEETFVQLAGWGYDIRDGLLTAIPDAGFLLDGHPRHPAQATRLLNEGDLIDLGDRALEVWHLPGHSPGSIGLWDASARTLFSGDVIYDGPLLNEIDSSNQNDYRHTMQRLRTVNLDVVHAGHNQSIGPARFHELIDTYLTD